MTFKNIDSDAFLAQMSEEGIVLLDVRTPVEYQEGHIPGSELLDYNNGPEFAQGLVRLDKDKKYLVYCRSGARSAAACAHMSQLGFEDVSNLLGGILDWQGPKTK